MVIVLAAELRLGRNDRTYVAAGLRFKRSPRDDATTRPTMSISRHCCTRRPGLASERSSNIIATPSLYPDPGEFKEGFSDCQVDKIVGRNGATE